MIKWKLLYIFLFICYSLLGISQETVSFETRLSKDKLGINERLKVEFVLNKNGDDFVAPNFNDFIIIGGPSQSMSQAWVNGKSSFSKSYSYYLQPEKTGLLTIKEAYVTIEDKLYQTKPVKVEVTSAVKNPNAPISATNLNNKDLFILASASNHSPYVNEKISVYYKLYWSSNVIISNLNRIEVPKYKNFWSHDIKVSELTTKTEIYNGKNYNTVILKKILLYPQIQGSIKINPLESELSIDVPTGRVDFFGRSLTTSAKKTISSNQLKINVKPLPEAGKPNSFNGAVGKFDLDVKLNKTTLKSGESLQATVSVKGNGNLKLIKMPSVSLPSSLEVYDPEHKENMNVNIAGIKGVITDIYTVVAQRQGQFPLNPIEFSYFDPKQKQYKTLSSKKRIINVEYSLDEKQDSQPIFKQNVRTPENRFNFIKIKTNFIPKEKPYFFKSTTYFILIIACFSIIPIVILIHRRKKVLDNDLERVKSAKVNKLAKKYLSEAKVQINDKDKFFIAFERALLNYLKAKLKIETIEFDKQIITQKLRQHKVELTVTEEFIKLLSLCEQARYNNGSNLEDIKKIYNKALENISNIDKQFS